MDTADRFSGKAANHLRGTANLVRDAVRAAPAIGGADEDEEDEEQEREGGWQGEAAQPLPGGSMQCEMARRAEADLHWWDVMCMSARLHARLSAQVNAMSEICVALQHSTGSLKMRLSLRESSPTSGGHGSCAPSLRPHTCSVRTTELMLVAQHTRRSGTRTNTLLERVVQR